MMRRKTIFDNSIIKHIKLKYVQNCKAHGKNFPGARVCCLEIFLTKPIHSTC